MVKRVLVAFDLDHTLIDKNSDTYILRLLPDGTQLPQSIKKLYTSAGWNDYMREVFRYLHSCHVTRDRLLACVAEIPLVEGMRQLLEFLNTSTLTTGTSDCSVREVTDDAHVADTDVTATQQQQQQQQHALMTSIAYTGSEAVPLVASSERTASTAFHTSQPEDCRVQFEVIIISDSNSAMIEHIFETTGLTSVFSKVYTNPASFDSSGCLQLSPYHHQDWCSLSQANMCKGHILDEHRRLSGVKYDVVAYVGDGANDFCPTLRLRETDIVFPRRGYSLEKYIAEGRDKVTATVRPWDTGLDIVSALKEVLMGAKA